MSLNNTRPEHGSNVNPAVAKVLIMTGRVRIAARDDESDLRDFKQMLSEDMDRLGVTRDELRDDHKERTENSASCTQIELGQRDCAAWRSSILFLVQSL